MEGSAGESPRNHRRGLGRRGEGEKEETVEKKEERKKRGPRSGGFKYPPRIFGSPENFRIDPKIYRNISMVLEIFGSSENIQKRRNGSENFRNYPVIFGITPKKPRKLTKTPF